MPTNVDDIISSLSPAQREQVETRARELIAEEMTLRDLRKARELTQVKLARRLGIAQDGVSRLEQRSDLLLSTLRKTVEAMGGTLSLVAQFPDRPPVVLSGLGSDDWAESAVWEDEETEVATGAAIPNRSRRASREERRRDRQTSNR